MSEKPDDLSLLLDHWIIVRKDGTPVLNGTPEKFEKELREFLFVERLLANSNYVSSHELPEPTCVLIRPKGTPEGKFEWITPDPKGGVDSFDI
jgi:hypothetical protein